MITSRVTAVFLPLMFLGCAEPQADSPADHVEEWSVSPDPLVMIGLLDGPREYVFSRVRSVRLLPDSGILVADGASGTLRFFSPDGEFLRQVGGLGNGPGEFQDISSVTIEDNEIRVYDSGLVRLSTFLAGGEFVDTEVFRPTDGTPELYLGRFSDGSHAIGWIRHSPLAPDRLTTDSMRIGRFSADGILISVLARSPGMRRLGSPAPLSPHLLVGMAGDSIVFTDGLKGLVRVLDPESPTARELQLPGAGWTVDDALHRLEERLGAESLERLRRLPRVAGIDVVPDFSDMLIDRENRIWLKLYDPATDSHWRSRTLTGGDWIVIDFRGRVIARATMPVKFRLMDVRGDRVAGILRDEADVERIAVYPLNASFSRARP